MSDKKREFMEKRKKRKAQNRVIIGAVVLVAIVGVALFTVLNQDTAVASRWEGGDYNIGRQIDYSDQLITMTDVELQVEDGKVLIPLDEVIENRLVYYEYNQGGTRLPMLSYISPSGRLVSAVAYCEPCRSESFHIDERQLVCDTCNTRWFLTDLRGLSGGCPDHPPEQMNYEVIDGMIVISEEDILSWVPRDYAAMEGF